MYQAVGDIDGDGTPEFLTGQPSVCAMFNVFDAVGNDDYERIWTFGARGARGIHPTGVTEHGARFGDTDGDGDDELAIAIGAWFAVFEWDGETFQRIFATRLCDECWNTSVEFADLDGDGRDSLVVTGWDMTNRADRDYSVPLAGAIHIFDRVPDR